MMMIVMVFSSLKAARPIPDRAFCHWTLHLGSETAVYKYPILSKVSIMEMIISRLFGLVT
jgi:hypothetical protein